MMNNHTWTLAVRVLMIIPLIRNIQLFHLSHLNLLMRIYDLGSTENHCFFCQSKLLEPHANSIAGTP